MPQKKKAGKFPNSPEVQVIRLRELFHKEMKTKKEQKTVLDSRKADDMGENVNESRYLKDSEEIFGISI